MRKYRVLLPLMVHTEDGSYTQFEEFEKDFSPEDEAANLDSGLLELVAATYRVVGDSRVFETPPGGLFTAPLRLEQESMLVAGGHIERVAEPATKKPRSSKEKGN